MKTYRVERHIGQEYVKADYVKFEGSFASFWEKAETHTGYADRLVVAYPAEQLETISVVRKTHE